MFPKFVLFYWSIELHIREQILGGYLKKFFFVLLSYHNHIITIAIILIAIIVIFLQRKPFFKMFSKVMEGIHEPGNIFKPVMSVISGVGILYIFNDAHIDAACISYIFW